ncbi:MAG: hypothetical protein LBK13_03645 [Spirochaetales bacterium]|nr:hypothetical protein [Spirochaetales bacterium]
MNVYTRTQFGTIKAVIIAPFTGILVFVLTRIFLPVPLCVVLGLAATVIVVCIAVFSGNIYFELGEYGTFRYFKRGTLRNTFELPKYRIGYYCKTKRGIFGNHHIELKLFDAAGEETDIDAGPLGTARFEEMFEKMEKYAITDAEVLDAEKK